MLAVRTLHNGFRFDIHFGWIAGWHAKTFEAGTNSKVGRGAHTLSFLEMKRSVRTQTIYRVLR